MRRPFLFPIALALELGVTRAAGQAPSKPAPGPFPLLSEGNSSEQSEETDPGYFDGLGTKGRAWELQSSTTFDTHRIFTQRFELAHAFELQERVDLVLRVSFGGDDAIRTGTYALQGPIPSLGVRDRSKSGAYWVEVGLRVIPPWKGPNDETPEALQLALGATLSSGAADDARWLPFTDAGLQLYGAIQSRTPAFDVAPQTQMLLGALYGGEGSLVPMKVRTWLGPQSGFVGNAFLELFATVPRAHGYDLGLQLGVHGDVSLSTIWPGDQPFPAMGSVFLGWSPKTWFAARVFVGVARSLSTPPPSAQGASTPYGLRLQLFLPHFI